MIEAFGAFPFVGFITTLISVISYKAGRHEGFKAGQKYAVEFLGDIAFNTAHGIPTDRAALRKSLEKMLGGENRTKPDLTNQ